VSQAAPTAGGARIEQAGELRSARIESLRAVAALGVLFGHVVLVSHGVGPTYLERALIGGGYGVYLFFVLSGYLLFWPFARRDYGDDESIDLRRYALNRALRILPLYYFVLAFLLLVQEDGGTLRQWLSFATFSENFSTSTFAKVDGVMWSLVVELHFYVLLPLLAFGIARLAHGSLRRAAVVLGVLAAASLVLRVGTVYLDSHPNLYLQYSIMSFFFFFVSGMMLALLRIAWREGPPSWLRGPLGSSSAWCATAVALMLAVFAIHEDWAEVLTAPASFLVVGASILPLRHGWVVRALEWRWLAATGVASYSLYLWHLPILERIGDIQDAPKSFGALLVIGGGLAIFSAFVSYRIVEAPFLRLRRRWARSTPERVTPGAMSDEPRLGMSAGSR
jgi:peptidoglycan/LPS O-acetylase OafA/YrhL